MKGLFYLDTFSISDHHSPENFHSREAIDIGVVRSFLQPTFSLGTNTSCQYWPNIRSAYYARDCGEIWGKYVKNYPTKYMNLFEEDSTKDSAWQGHLRGAYGNTCPMFSQLFGPPKTQKGKCKLDSTSTSLSSNGHPPWPIFNEGHLSGSVKSQKWVISNSATSEE